MFGIGMNEFLLLVLLALVLIGPKQLPEVARGIGKLMVAFRRATSDLRNAVSEEINAHPEYRELTKLRDEISQDIRHVGSRARGYIEKEFEEEKRIADGVKQDVSALGDKVQSQINEAAQEPNLAGQDISGPPAEAAEEAHADAEPPDRTEFDKAYRSFYTTGPAATDSTAADSPEDAHLREREAQAQGNGEPAAAGDDDKAGLYLLRTGGRGGGRGGPYNFTPPAPSNAEGETADSGKDGEPESSQAAGGDKA